MAPRPLRIRVQIVCVGCWQPLHRLVQLRLLDWWRCGSSATQHQVAAVPRGRLVRARKSTAQPRPGQNHDQFSLVASRRWTTRTMIWSQKQKTMMPNVMRVTRTRTTPEGMHHHPEVSSCGRRLSSRRVCVDKAITTCTISLRHRLGRAHVLTGATALAPSG